MKRKKETRWSRGEIELKGNLKLHDSYEDGRDVHECMGTKVTLIARDMGMQATEVFGFGRMRTLSPPDLEAFPFSAYKRILFPIYKDW